VEHLSTLRLIPNMSVWRPCDEIETAVAWRCAIERGDGPTCLLLSRQGLPAQSREPAQIDTIERGGYVLSDCEGLPEAIVIATGSEVGIAVEAACRLVAEGRGIRVVSMPSLDVFESQDPQYRADVLPPEVGARVVVEAGVTQLWYRYAGSDGRILGIDRFGGSAPGGTLMSEFGFTAEGVEALLREVLP